MKTWSTTGEWWTFNDYFCLTFHHTQTPTLPTSYCYTSSYITRTIPHHLPSLPWHLPPPCSPWLSRTPSPPPPQNHSPSHTETWRGGGGECTMREREGRGRERGRGWGWRLTRWTLEMKQISRWTRFRLGDSACRHCRFHTSSRLIEPRQLRHYLLTAVTLLLDDSAGRFLLNSHGPRAFSKYWILGNEYCCVKTSFRSPHLAAQLNGFYFQIRHLEVTAVWWRIVLANLWWFLCLQSVAEYRANVPSTCKKFDFLHPITHYYHPVWLQHEQN